LTLRYAVKTAFQSKQTTNLLRLITQSNNKEPLLPLCSSGFLCLFLIWVLTKYIYFGIIIAIGDVLVLTGLCAMQVMITAHGKT